MGISNLIRGNKTVNKCKHCRISHLCLTANIQKKLLKQYEQFAFKSRLLEPGEHLIRQGERRTALYAIRSGILKSFTTSESGKDYVMGFHLPPDLFGWEAISEKTSTVSTVALDHTNVCEIPLTQLLELIRTVPEMELQFLQLVSQRIHRGNMGLLRTTVEQRVASFLLRLAENYTMLGYPYYLCKMLMTHQDIANFLRIAPETISRSLKSLQQRKIISVTKQNIYLNDIQTLRELAATDS